MRFAVFLTGDASPYTQSTYGSYADLFEDLLRRDGDVWDVFDVREHRYPASFEDYDAVLITGSASDAHGDESWIARLEAAIREAVAAPTKVLGFCFGHQALANALGGRTGRNSKGWEAGVYRLEFTRQANAHPLLAEIDSLDLLEIHQDHILELPPDAEVLAATDATPVQIFVIGDRALGIQGHPEFHNDIVQDLVLARAESGVIEGDKAGEFLQRLKREQDREKLQALINRFLGR